MNYQIDIIFEDNHLIAVNKPAGVLVQGDETQDEPLVEAMKGYLKAKYNKPGNVFCGVIHRLDRPVSGVVVLAKTSKGLEKMNKLFQDRTIDKTYLALVQNSPEQDSGTLVNWLKKNTEKNVVWAYDEPVKDSVRAELTYKTLGRVGRFYLLEVHPLTGRPHQIRTQLGRMGCPIRGDLKYGATEGNRDGNISLHAYRLTFEHPIKKEPVRITAALPQDPIWQEFRALLPKKDRD